VVDKVNESVSNIVIGGLLSQSSTGTFYTCNHRRVVIGVSQKKATNVDPSNSALGRKWVECIDKEPLRERKEKEVGELLE